MKRDITYRTRTLERLIEGYAFEVGRGNQEDKEITQRAIVNEIYARIKDTFTMLESNPDEWQRIYKQLIEF